MRPRSVERLLDMLGRKRRADVEGKEGQLGQPVERLEHERRRGVPGRQSQRARRRSSAMS